MILKLIEKGVKIPNPESVYISEDVDLNRISGKNVILHSGTKLIGSKTLISDNVQIGYESCVTLENTLVGPGGRLNGGYFQGAVFLKDNVFGSGAHVRKGTILEEQANAAHTVGLKQTILFPFVTLGSLINFCDCLMAGGTSRKNHSEVGSSFIHFNYTPNQDKATPSMMGNVHQGVMLDQPPVFMGGQGGLVGPARIGFACITAAGSVIRKSEERPGRLMMGGTPKNTSMPWRPGIYSQPAQIMDKNLSYIAELYGLKAWYHYVRPLFAEGIFSRELITGLQENIDCCIRERIHRLMAFGGKLQKSRDILAGRAKGQGSETVAAHDNVLKAIRCAKGRFDNCNELLAPDNNGKICISALEQGIANQGKDYVSVIQALSKKDAAAGSAWLHAVETKVKNTILQD